MALALALVVSFAIAEIGTRRWRLASPLAPLDERSLVYQFNSRLGWFPVPNSARFYTGSRRISIRDNSIGFRDHEYGPKRKPRVVFLGDSFVWGYDVEQNERFTDQLQSVLLDWEVMNLGVSGYGTDQEYLLLQDTIDRLRPDIVFLLICSENDRDDNSSSFRYEYYKPYFVADHDQLRLAGVPVPKSMRYYQAEHPALFELLGRSAILTALTNVAGRVFLPRPVQVPDPTVAIVQQTRDLAASKQARFLCGVTDPRPGLEAGLQSRGIACLDLGTDFRYPSHGNHWTPQGHKWVSGRLLEFLTPWLEAVRPH